MKELLLLDGSNVSGSNTFSLKSKSFHTIKLGFFSFISPKKNSLIRMNYMA